MLFVYLLFDHAFWNKRKPIVPGVQRFGFTEKYEQRNFANNALNRKIFFMFYVVRISRMSKFFIVRPSAKHRAREVTNLKSRLSRISAPGPVSGCSRRDLISRYNSSHGFALMSLKIYRVSLQKARFRGETSEKKELVRDARAQIAEYLGLSLFTYADATRRATIFVSFVS